MELENREVKFWRSEAEHRSWQALRERHKREQAEARCAGMDDLCCALFGGALVGGAFGPHILPVVGPWLLRLFGVELGR